MWRILRIAVLLLALVAVASQAWLERAGARDWTEPLWVGIFPIGADDDPATEAYLGALQRSSFDAIERYFEAEGREYGLALERPVHIELYPRVARRPPELPAQAGWLRTAAWSLAMRWYAWRVTSGAEGAPANIRLFVQYHAPERLAVLPHSVGLSKGLMGVVHAYADRGHEGGNDIVIAHELLHTLGATDKYDLATLQPLYPAGYAEPEHEPRYPQALAEIMAGRRALSAREAEMPASLDGTAIGPSTAREIAWSVP